MEVAQARYFVALCKERSFTRAAQQCAVSQPSLSNGIRALERELGGDLFERSSMTPTRLGKRVLPHLQSMLDSVERVRNAARTARRATVRRALAQTSPSVTFLSVLALDREARAGDANSVLRR